jgi:DNA polymerase I-like protein with 3'-5' exonuclease and polymerase domains
MRKGLEPPPEYYNLTPSLEDVRQFTSRKFTFDIETNGWTKEISIVGISSEPYSVVVVPFRGAYVGELQRIFRDAEEVTGHNCLQFDLPVLRHNGVYIPQGCTVYDTMLFQHLVFPDLPHDLEFVGSQFSSKPAWKHDKDVFERYCARDVDVTIQAFRALKPMLEEKGLLDLYLDVQVPLSYICKLMHETGFTVSTARVAEVRKKLIHQSKEEEAYLPTELRTYSRPCRVRRPAPAGTLSPKTGKPIKFIHEESSELIVPWRSPQRKQEYLYGTESWQLACEPVRDAKSGNITTGKLALDKLYRRALKDKTLVEKGAPRAIQALKNLNKWDELISTFASEAMVKLEKQHPHFNVHGTNSGRLSSTNPNAQNIPESARVMYVPSHEGWRILECFPGDTRVLTGDLRWVEAQTLKVGDPVWAFDENPSLETGYKRKTRRFHLDKVTNTSSLQKECVRIVTDKGEITTSLNHSWLVRNGKGTNYKWIPASDLKCGAQVAFFKEPWASATEPEEFWLSGLLDGEGWITKSGGCGVAQNPGLVLKKVKETLSKNAFAFNENSKQKCVSLTFKGESFAFTRLAGFYRPVRLLENACKRLNGMQTWGYNTENARIISIENVGMREVFAIETGLHTLVANGFLTHNCDYSNIENRLTAWFSNDEERLRRFREIPNFTEHKWACEIFFGIPMAEVEKDNDKDAPYGKAKRIVHGTGYGLGAKKMSMMFDMDFKETKELIDKWKKALPELTAWQERTVAQATRQGYLRNPFGRMRWFYTSSLYTESLSFLPQSTAADVIFRAMIGLMWERIGLTEEQAKKVSPVVAHLPKECNLLLQVHDSLIWEYAPHIEEQLILTVKSVMEQPFKELGGLSLPIGIQTSDSSWGEVEPWKH